MVEQRRRFIDNAIAVTDDVEKGSQIVTAHCLAARTQRRVETADGAQCFAAKCHIGTRPKDPGTIGVQHSGRAMFLQIKDAAFKAFAKATILLDPLLGGRLQFGGQDHACDTAHVVACLKALHNAAEPLAIDAHIVIGKGDQRGIDLAHAAIVCHCQPRLFLAHIAQIGMQCRAVTNQAGGGFGCRLVIHHQNFKVGIIHRQQRVERQCQAGRTVAGGNDNADKGRIGKQGLIVLFAGHHCFGRDASRAQSLGEWLAILAQMLLNFVGIGAPDMQCQIVGAHSFGGCL